MNQDKDWLKALVARRTQETWPKRQQPYYISFIATDATKEGADYRVIIAPLKLRQWALTVEINGVKAIAHPVHKAKVGFIPAQEEYVFADGEGSQVSELAPKDLMRASTRRLTIQFLEALARLPDEALDEILIPVKTIVRLLNG